MSLSGVFKFILGFVLAIALLFLAGAGLTRYMLARLSTPPPRPTFPNDPPNAAVNSAANPAASPEAPAAPAASPEAAASPSPSPSAGYRARVTQPIGLIVRAEADANAAQITGVEYNREVTVLEDSSDGAWQKVRLTDGREGWVKGGNTERIN